jgi:DNA primase
MYSSMDLKEDIKARLNIEDVVGEYVQLKRAGRNLKGLSPFSHEKTPSFMVSPEKQIWHDFSSGKGGNIFSFIMEVEGVDFKESLELLARKAGLDMAKYRTAGQSNNTKLKNRLYEASELAAKYYQTTFTKHTAALDYIFKKRAFSKQTVLDFRIGYAPNTGTALLDFMKRKGFSSKELSQAGLITQRYNGDGDMFRGRIMIPLMDAQGRVLGFTARILEDDPNAPKYLNTPQTPLYDKGRHVFGLHLAKEAIRKEKFAVVVEGNLDVLASHHAGVTNVVATAGTAMTESHLKEIGRFSQNIRLAFDTDDAGIAATERAIPIAEKVGVNISIISIPSGKDPDELIKQEPTLWQQAITVHDDVLDWLITQYQKRADLATHAGRDQFKQAVLASVKRLQSAGEQGLYTKKVADILGYSQDAITDELRLLKEDKKTYRTIKVEPEPVDRKRLELKRVQDHLLGVCLLQPALRFNLMSLTDDMLQDNDARKLLAYLNTQSDAPPAAGLPEELSDITDYVKIITLQYEQLYQGLGLLELRNEAARLQTRLVEEYVKTKKHVLSAALRTADEQETETLLMEVRELDQLLKSHKGGR